MTVKTWRWFVFAAPLFAAWAVDAKPHYREVDIRSLGDALPFAIDDAGVIAMQKFVAGQLISFLYDSRKVTRLKEVGRLSLPPSQLASIKIPGTTTPSPYPYSRVYVTDTAMPHLHSIL